MSKRFLHEAADSGSVVKTGVPAAPAEAPIDRYSLDEVPTGEVIKDSRGNPAFEKTDAGWKSVIKVPLERILMLVKEANRAPVGKLLKDAGEGEVLTILLGFLADTEDANTDKGLRLKKVDGMFMDPVSIAPDKIKLIADQLKYQPPAKKDGAEKTSKVELGPDDRVFNNIIFKYDSGKLKVIVDLDKGGTAQLKRLLGSDAAVTKADEEIAKAPTSGETKITLDTPTKGSTLFTLAEKPRKLKDPVFRYLPGKKLLVLDVAEVDQTLWETLAQKLDVGKEAVSKDAVSKAPSIGITYADLRSMKAGQIVEETITDDRDKTTKYAYAKKVFADVLYIIPRDVAVTNLYSGKKQVTPDAGDKLLNKIYTNSTGGTPKDFKVIVGLNEKGDKAFKQVFTYESLLEELRDNVTTKKSESLSEAATKSITYRITDPEEEI